MKAKKKKWLLIIGIPSSLIILISIYVIASVHVWMNTEAGKVPPKTAVLLHAINEKIVTTSMKVPNFLNKTGNRTYSTQMVQIPTFDGDVIEAKVYQPLEGTDHPIILYYHGGAFMEGYGDIQTHDNIVRALAVRTKSIVISVDYRVAPIYPYPTAIEDSYSALLWAVDHAGQLNGDMEKIAVVGDSAGGNLATVVALMARDREGPKIKAQALLYPLTTFQDIDFLSRTQFDSGYYLLSRNVMLKARDLYTPDEQTWILPYTSPLEAETLTGLPPALVITAEFDPLRDEGEAYAKRMASYGIPVEAIRYNGVMHGFISFYEVMGRADHGLYEAAQYLNYAFANEPAYSSYHLQVYDGGNRQSQIREHLEAYAIGGFLLSKQLLTYLGFSQ